MARFSRQLGYALAGFLILAARPTGAAEGLKDTLDIGWRMHLPVTRQEYLADQGWMQAGYIEGMAAAFRYLLMQPGADSEDRACFEQYGTDLFGFGVEFGHYLDTPDLILETPLPDRLLLPDTPVAEVFLPFLRTSCRESRKYEKELGIEPRERGNAFPRD